MPSYERASESVEKLNPEFIMVFKAFFEPDVRVKAVNANNKTIEISPKKNIDDRLGVVIHPDTHVTIDTGIIFREAKNHILQLFPSDNLIDKNLSLMTGIQLDILDDGKRIFVRIHNKSTATRWIYQNEPIANGFVTKTKISNLIPEYVPGEDTTKGAD